MTQQIVSILIVVVCVLVAVGAVYWSISDTLSNVRGLRTDVLGLTFELRALREQMRNGEKRERIASMCVVGGRGISHGGID